MLQKQPPAKTAVSSDAAVDPMDGADGATDGAVGATESASGFASAPDVMASNATGIATTAATTHMRVDFWRRCMVILSVPVMESNVTESVRSPGPNGLM